MSTALVTGATGFIGGALVKDLIANGYKVYCVAREGKAHLLPKSDKCVPIICGMADIGKLLELVPKKEIDVVFHVAWAGVAGNDKLDAYLQLENVKWTLDLLDVVASLGCERFVCTGSLTELEVGDAIWSPEISLSGDYAYGAGKIAAHAMCKVLGEKKGVDVLWPVITNAYGVGELNLRMVNSTICKCIRNEPVSFTEGVHNYDFIYIDDVSRALRLIGEKGKPGRRYVIGSGAARPLKEFLLEMKAAIDTNSSFEFGAFTYKGNYLPIEYFDTSNLERDVGFKAEISFKSGCQRTYQWWKERMYKHED